MKFTKLLIAALAILFFNSCSQGIKEFNDDIVKNVSLTNSYWENTLGAIASNDSFGGADINKMATLQKQLEDNIKKVQSIGVVKYGKKYHQSVIDLYNYAIGTCKTYPTIFQKKPSKYTLQEWQDWIKSAHNRYEYYFTIIENEQVDFANKTNSKLNKSPF